MSDGIIQVGENVKILVAEPWDFQITSGLRYAEAQIIDSVDTKYGMAFLAKNLKFFKMDGNDINYMILIYRSRKNNPTAVNAYYIPDELVHRFKEHITFENKLVFTLIGKLI